MGGMLIFCGNAAALSAASFFDIRKKRIPNICVLAMFAFLLVIKSIIFFHTGSGPDSMQILKSTAGALAPLFVMLPAELLTGKKFGYGDKKALMVLGLSTGAWGIIFVIFGMLAGAAVFSMVKRIKRDECLALAPFILMSYLVVCCTGVVPV